MINILQKLINKEITEEQAYNIMEMVVENYHKGNLEEEPRIKMNFNNYEWTALCHGLSLSVLAEWHQKGWPDVCSYCGKTLDYKKYGWIIENNQIVGLNCH